MAYLFNAYFKLQKMRTDKIISGVLIGAAIGAIAGLLMTEKGKQIRGTIQEQSGVLLSSLWSILSKGKKFVSDAEKLTENARAGNVAKKSAAS